MDAFVGSYVMESRDNFDAFMKGIGVPEKFVEAAKNAKVETEFKVEGDTMTVTRVRPQKTTTHTFKLGEANEVDTPKGDKMNVTVNLEGGKLVAKGDQYCVSSEIVDGKLKEVITLKEHTMTRVSTRK